ncbi:MAG: hypothetical protein DHS20C05_04220 [Hyphococcus sp.]|nr:MAG: hypothetical protein DHS20C05_04220 [Marinicaulis sp.]
MTRTVERFNVVDRDGTLRLAIANRANAPGVVYRGKTYPKRSIEDLVGMIFYEADSDEAGGLGLAKRGEKNNPLSFLAVRTSSLMALASSSMKATMVQVGNQGSSSAIAGHTSREK